MLLQQEEQGLAIKKDFLIEESFLSALESDKHKSIFHHIRHPFESTGKTIFHLSFQFLTRSPHP